MKFCVKCKYFVPPEEGAFATCTHKTNMVQETGWEERLMVFGEATPHTEPKYWCGALRTFKDSEFCGRDARFYEAKDD